jgi:hypothetical protein
LFCAARKAGAGIGCFWAETTVLEEQAQEQCEYVDGGLDWSKQTKLVAHDSSPLSVFLFCLQEPNQLRGVEVFVFLFGGLVVFLHMVWRWDVWGTSEI